jgi:RNA polymerase sigma-70 factor (ECF subfamily)
MSQKDAQEALVHKFGPTLLAVCNRYCYDSNLAYDALQECFICVFKYINTYKSTGSFEGWLRRIAVRSSLAIIKKYKPFSFFEDSSDLDFKNGSTIPDAYEQIALDELHYFLQQLPPSLRLVFNMYIVEGYSHKEIGEMLKISDSTSRANLTRARSKLVSLINEEAQKRIYSNTRKIQI